MTLSFSIDLRNDRASEINDALGAGAKVKFYTGTAPSTVNDTPIGTLLAECICNASGFGTVSAGRLEADAVSGESYVAYEDSALATGTIGYARVTDSSDVAHIQEDSIGLEESGAAIIVSKMTIDTGEDVQVNSLVIIEGNP